MNYPEHCKDCWKLTECEQKEHMLPDTEPSEGYADFDMADYVCVDCLIPIHNHAPLSGETDTPAHCAICGVPLDMALTSDGIEYVQEAIASGIGCCRELWPVLFADYLN